MAFNGARPPINRPPLNRPPISNSGPPGGGFPPWGNFPMMPMPPMGGNMFMGGPPGFMNRGPGPRPMPPRPRPPFPGQQQQGNNKPPPTTVFVGNITEHASDKMIKELLARCGNVLSWKRVQGASGKLQAFGFCEYEDPEATMRCIRILHEWEIGEKKLVVRVDAKTKQLLDNYKNSKKGGGSVISSKPKKYEDGKEKSSEDGKEGGAEKEDGEEEEEVLDEEILREDRIAKAGLEAIMREYVGEIKAAVEKGGREKEREPSKEPSKEMSIEKDRSSRGSSQLSGPGRTSDDAIVIEDESSNSATATHRKLNSKLEMAHVTTHKVLKDFEDNKLDAIDMEEEKKAMLRREIDQFRNTYKDSHTVSLVLGSGCCVNPHLHPPPAAEDANLLLSTTVEIKILPP